MAVEDHSVGVRLACLQVGAGDETFMATHGRGERSILTVTHEKEGGFEGRQ
jgi:hypothetical protein